MQPYLGTLCTDSCTTWCVRTFHHVLLKYGHIKCVNAKNDKLMTSHFNTLYWTGLKNIERKMINVECKMINVIHQMLRIYLILNRFQWAKKRFVHYTDNFCSVFSDGGAYFQIFNKFFIIGYILFCKYIFLTSE